MFLASLGPAGWLTWAGLTGHLSADPLADLTNETGVWTLRFVCLTIAVSPARRLTGWNSVIRFRRMLGLFAFFYGSLHFLTYAIVDRFAGLDFPNGIVSWRTVHDLGLSVAADVYKRPFIMIGALALLSMVPLALTSTAAMIRRLGGRRWQMLHRLVYVTAIAAVVHYWWLVKADVRRPEAYAALVGALLVFRVWWVWGRAMAPARSRAYRVSSSPPPLTR